MNPHRSGRSTNATARLSERLFGRRPQLRKLVAVDLAGCCDPGLSRSSYAFTCIRRGRRPNGRSGWEVLGALRSDARWSTLPDGSHCMAEFGHLCLLSRSFRSRTAAFLSAAKVYMDVTKDPERPFRVDTRSVSIRVLGTRFNVRSNKRGQVCRNVARGGPASRWAEARRLDESE